MNLKNICLRCWSILTYPHLWFNGKTRFLFSKVKGMKGNDFKTEESYIKKSVICFSGKGNTIDLKRGCELFNCNILLRGSGHLLLIEKEAHLQNIRIKIIGNNNIIHIGPRTSLGSGNLVSGGTGISIQVGQDCMIAEGVDIWSTDTHSVFQDGQLVNKPESIIIGDHVWIGKDVAILKGVTIGDNAVVGMRSMVTTDVPPATLSVGSPARVIREGIDWNRCNPNNE